MKTRRRPKFMSTAYLLFGACTSCYLLFFAWYEYGVWLQGHRPPPVATPSGPGQRQPHRHTSLHLTAQQCEATFPGLTKDIDDTVALGPFDIHPSGQDGQLQVQIKDDQLLIFLPNRSAPLSPELLDAQTSTLSLLHRALLTSPDPLPSTILTLNIHDIPFGTSLSYARAAFRPPAGSSPGAPVTRAFLMPHFSFWAWPLPSIGSLRRAAEEIDKLEKQLKFADKDPRVAWRGTTGWNSAHYPGQREELLKVAGQAEWADVQALRGYDNDSNALMIESFCRYKYLLYTEGITYSGRLHFLQHCASVLLSPPIAWLQHTTHLIKPVWSCDLLNTSTDSTSRWEPTEEMTEAWPRYATAEANAVFVAPDWSDLEETVGWLEDHPDIAEGIARRQRDMFVGGGYLSPGAEACYWRALIRGWSEVVRYDETEWEGRERVPWETWSLGHSEKVA